MKKQLTIIKNSRHQLHKPPFEVDAGKVTPHQEQPARIDNIEMEIIESEIKPNYIEIENFGEDIIKNIHTPELIHSVREISAASSAYEYSMPYVFSSIKHPKHRSRELKRVSYHCMDMGTPIGRDTFDTAMLSASIAYRGATEVMNGSKLLYGLCRPPGHHAEKNIYGGYCYFNNAGVAAMNFVKNAKGKVAVLDVDYHHGNGTQDVFYDTDAVLYVSIHGHPNSEYPYYTGFDDETGTGKGLGYNTNIPLPRMTGETEYMKALEKACERINKYKPDFLIISLGLDTYKHDPICTFRLEISSYYNMAKRLLSLGYPVLILQEGGYYVPDLGKLAVSFLDGALSVLNE